MTTTRHYHTMTSDLSFTGDSGSPPVHGDMPAGTKVVIVSGGPLNMKLDPNEEKEQLKVDDGSLSASPSTVGATASPTGSVVSMIPTTSAATVGPKTPVDYRVEAWCGTKLYSDLVQDGLKWLGKPQDNVVMVYESPSYETQGTSFINAQKFFFHDSPAGSPIPRTVLGPLRYAAMTGNAFPVYTLNEPDAQLVKHWKSSMPFFKEPKFVHSINKSTDNVYAYLPLEEVANHVHDPAVHYHVAGKDAIPLMTNATTKLLPDTKQVRPCIAKVNHSMGSRGIFVIRNDEDEQEFVDFLNETNNPAYIVSEFIQITRNIACHFFIHPSGHIIWLGSSENVRLEDGSWSSDSTMDKSQQAELQALQMPGARDVADYLLSLGFWGLCGIDVLIDEHGQRHVVDVNPRVTGTCPALLTFHHMQKSFGFDYGLFRRSSSHAYPGTVAQLCEEVEAFNQTHNGESRAVLFSVSEVDPECTLLNIGVYGKSLDECEEYLDHFSCIFKAKKKCTYM
jgi:ATP-grasp domain